MADELLPGWLAEVKEQLDQARGSSPTVREGASSNFIAIGTPKALTSFSPGLRAALPWVNGSFNFNEPALAGDSDDRLREAYAILNTWDHRATIDSIAMTIFNRWRDRVNRATQKPVTAQVRVAALSEALDTLEKDFGTWRVKWGDLNRLQRYDESKREPFSDARLSLPVPGISGADGGVFTFQAVPINEQKRFYGSQVQVM